MAPAILTVNSAADTASPADPYLSLREAIAIVNSPTLPNGLSDQILAQISGTLHEDGADSIVFDPAAVTGPIVLGGSQLELSLPAGTATVTIDGGDPGVTVDGNNASRVFRVDAGAQASFDHLTLSHGGATGDVGGGIANFGTLAVTSSTLSADSAGTYGGGIENEATLTVTDCTFSGNSASYYGGGIYNIGTVTATNSTLSGNSAGYGGAGIENIGGMLTLINSTVSANVTSGLGGGINNEGMATVTACTFSGNSAATYGGGIYNFEGIVTVTNSTLSGNSANASNGGGIDNALYGLLTVTNSTLSGNTAGTLGGGIDNENRGTVTVTSCTLSANTARSGGGINNTFGPVTLGNTIVAGNTGGDISGGGTYSQTYSLLGGQPRLAPLGDYGGPTQTMPLLAGSPALEAGDPALAGTPDQRGVARTGGVNIGAFQASATAIMLTAPAMVLTGVPFDITVMAVDIFGQTAVGYTGTITFNSTDMDPNVVLPADYPFQLSDAGSVTFTAAVTLFTPGDQTLTATDTADHTITGSATVTVGGTAPGPGSHGQEQPRQPSRLQRHVPPASESSHHEVGAGDRWFFFLNQTDPRFAFSRPFHNARAGMDRWTLDPWWGDEPIA